MGIPFGAYALLQKHRPAIVAQLKAETAKKCLMFGRAQDDAISGSKRTGIAAR